MGKPAGKKLTDRWARKTPIKKQLEGMKCDHPSRARQTNTNSKGKQFNECGACGAFLGWV